MGTARTCGRCGAAPNERRSDRTAVDPCPGFALRHRSEALGLGARGWQVTAVDFSATALAHARPAGPCASSATARSARPVEGQTAPAGQLRGRAAPTRRLPHPHGQISLPGHDRSNAAASEQSAEMWTSSTSRCLSTATRRGSRPGRSTSPSRTSRAEDIETEPQPDAWGDDRAAVEGPSRSSTSPLASMTPSTRIWTQSAKYPGIRSGLLANPWTARRRRGGRVLRGPLRRRCKSHTGRRRTGRTLGTRYRPGRAGLRTIRPRLSQGSRLRRAAPLDAWERDQRDSDRELPHADPSG